MTHYERALGKFEKKYLVKLLVNQSGNITKVSSISGLQRHQILRMMKRNQILVRKPPKFGESPIKGPDGWAIIYRHLK